MMNGPFLVLLTTLALRMSEIVVPGDIGSAAVDHYDYEAVAAR